MMLHITRNHTIEVTTVADAANAIVAHWGRRGATAFYRDPQAGIIEENNVQTAHVSFNGRVWAGVERTRTGNREIMIGGAS